MARRKSIVIPEPVHQPQPKTTEQIKLLNNVFMETGKVQAGTVMSVSYEEAKHLIKNGLAEFS